jgi:hypothetical protein
MIILALLISSMAINSKENGTYSAKFACTRMARSTDLLCPAPIDTLCCRLALITLIERKTKNIAKIAEENGVIIMSNSPLIFWSSAHNIAYRAVIFLGLHQQIFQAPAL